MFGEASLLLLRQAICDLFVSYKFPKLCNNDFAGRQVSTTFSSDASIFTSPKRQFWNDYDTVALWS
jgi:hypothetical protein